MFSRRFWIETAERAAKTAGQVLAAALGTNLTLYRSLDWTFIGMMVAGATLFSVATSLASINVGQDKGGPSAV